MTRAGFIKSLGTALLGIPLVSAAEMVSTPKVTNSTITLQLSEASIKEMTARVNTHVNATLVEHIRQGGLRPQPSTQQDPS